MNFQQFFEALGREQVTFDEALADADQIEQWHRDKGMIAFSLREFASAGLVVDVLVRPRVAYDELRRSAVIKPLGEASIPVASVAHLIRLKAGTGRSIDAFDIAQLTRLKASNS